MISSLYTQIRLAFDVWINLEAGTSLEDQTGYPSDLTNSVTSDDVNVTDEFVLLALHDYIGVESFEGTKWNEDASVDAYCELESVVFDALTSGTTFDAWQNSGLFDKHGLTFWGIQKLIFDITQCDCLERNGYSIIDFALRNGLADLLPIDSGPISAWKLEHLLSMWHAQNPHRATLVAA